MCQRSFKSAHFISPGPHVYTLQFFVVFTLNHIFQGVCICVFVFVFASEHMAKFCFGLCNVVATTCLYQAQTPGHR